MYLITLIKIDLARLKWHLERKKAHKKMLRGYKALMEYKRTKVLSAYAG